MAGSLIHIVLDQCLPEYPVQLMMCGAVIGIDEHSLEISWGPPGADFVTADHPGKATCPECLSCNEPKLVACQRGYLAVEDRALRYVMRHGDLSILTPEHLSWMPRADLATVFANTYEACRFLTFVSLQGGYIVRHP